MLLNPIGCTDYIFLVGTLGPVGSTNLFRPICDTEYSSCLSDGLATAGDEWLGDFMGHLFCDR